MDYSVPARPLTLLLKDWIVPVALQVAPHKKASAKWQISSIPILSTVYSMNQLLY